MKKLVECFWPQFYRNNNISCFCNQSIKLLNLLRLVLLLKTVPIPPWDLSQETQGRLSGKPATSGCKIFGKVSVLQPPNEVKPSWKRSKLQQSIYASIPPLETPQWDWTVPENRLRNYVSPQICGPLTRGYHQASFSTRQCWELTGTPSFGQFKLTTPIVPIQDTLHFN